MGFAKPIYRIPRDRDRRGVSAARLRVENQLGFKMVKWIQAIELVEDVSGTNKGEVGYAEDNEYFGELASI